MRLLIFFPAVMLAVSAHAACDDLRCVALRDSWCMMPVAVERSALPAWLEADAWHYKEAEAARQTCKPYQPGIIYAYCGASGKCEVGLKEKAMLTQQ